MNQVELAGPSRGSMTHEICLCAKLVNALHLTDPGSAVDAAPTLATTKNSSNQVEPGRIFHLKRLSQVFLFAVVAFVLLVTASMSHIILLSVAMFFYIIFEWTTAKFHPDQTKMFNKNSYINSTGSNKVEMALKTMSEEILAATAKAIAKAWTELRSMDAQVE